MRNKILLATACLVSLNVVAADGEQSGSYVGVGAMVSQYDANHIEFDGWGSRVFGGYRFNDYLAAEISVGQVRIDDSINGVDVSGEGSGIAVSILPMMPITNNLDGFLCLGYGYGTTDVSIESEYVDHPTHMTDSDSAWSVGAGLMWSVGDNIFVRGAIGSPTEDFGDTITAGIDIGFKF